jgi:deoxyadenosine/deoxycytidine kinase
MGKEEKKRKRKKKTGNVISIYSDLHLNTNHIIPQNMFQSIFTLYNTLSTFVGC